MFLCPMTYSSIGQLIVQTERQGVALASGCTLVYRPWEGGNSLHTITAGFAVPTTNSQAGIESLDIVSYCKQQAG